MSPIALGIVNIQRTHTTVDLESKSEGEIN